MAAALGGFLSGEVEFTITSPPSSFLWKFLGAPRRSGQRKKWREEQTGPFSDLGSSGSQGKVQDNYLQPKMSPLSVSGPPGTAPPSVLTAGAARAGRGLHLRGLGERALRLLLGGCELNVHPTHMLGPNLTVFGERACEEVVGVK